MGEIVKFDFLVDSSQFNNSLATMQQDFNSYRQSVLQGFNSIVFDSFLNNLNSLKNAFAATFGAFLSEAEKIEDVAARLGVMLGGDAAGGEKLAHSLERLATNGVVPLQELEQAAAALSSRFASTADISQWVSVCADISAGSKITATRLAEMTARLDDMGKAEFTELANAGIPIYSTLAKVLGITSAEVVKLAAAGKVSSDDFLAALRLMTAEGAKFHDLNATMSNTTSGSWATLAASWREIMAEVGSSLNSLLRPILQNLSSFLQNNKETFALLVGIALKFAVIMGSLSALKFSFQLASCLKSMLGMKAAAESMQKSSRAIGKAGIVALLSAGWELGSAVADFFSGAEEAAAKAEQQRRELNMQRIQAEEQDQRDNRLAEAQATALDNAKLLDDLELKLRTANTEQEFSQAAKQLTEEMKKLAKAYDDSLVVGDSAANHLRYENWKRSSSLYDELDHLDAQRKEREKEAQRKEISKTLLSELLNMESARSSRKFEDSFDKLTSADQRFLLKSLLQSWGYRGGDSIDSLDAGMLAILGNLQSRADSVGFSTVQGYYNLLPRIQTKQKEEAIKDATGRKGLLDFEHRLDLLTARESADANKMRQLEAAQAALKLAQELQGYGISPDVAKARAAQVIAREMALNTQSPASSREFVADSLATIGGGGRGFSLGEAQLQLAREQVNVLVNSQQILSDINKKMEYLDKGTIKVVP